MLRSLCAFLLAVSIALPFSPASDWQGNNATALRYTQSGEYDRAAVYYRRVIASNPAFLPAHKNLGTVLWFGGHRKESETIFRKLTPAIPADPVPHLYIALASYERHQFAEAKTHFAQAGDLAFANPDVLPAVVDTWLSLKDDSILPQAMGFARGTRDFGMSTALAAILDRHNRPAEALQVLTFAAEANPDNEQVYLALAAFASSHANEKYASEVIERGLARIPRSALLHLQSGLLAASTGNREAALRSLRSAADLDRKSSLPLLATGVLHLEDGRAELAAETFSQAVALAPAEWHGYYFHALALSRAGEKRSGEAIALLRKALALAPEEPRPRVLLGQLLTGAGELEAGVRELKRALAKDTNNTAALYAIAMGYRKLGQAELARSYMAKFSAAKAGSREAEESNLVQIMRIVR